MIIGRNHRVSFVLASWRPGQTRRTQGNRIDVVRQRLTTETANLACPAAPCASSQYRSCPGRRGRRGWPATDRCVQSPHKTSLFLGPYPGRAEHAEPVQNRTKQPTTSGDSAHRSKGPGHTMTVRAESLSSAAKPATQTPHPEFELAAQATTC